jgi:hypothetical protein
MIRAIAFSATLLIGLAGSGWAQQARSPQPGWVVDGRTGCRLWNGVPLHIKGVAWSGACLNGLAHGQGEAEWTHNNWQTFYRGEMIAGKYEGRGVLTHSFGGG